MATLIAPRYSADDFETGSIRSVAPSYSEYLSEHAHLYRPHHPPTVTCNKRQHELLTTS